MSSLDVSSVLGEYMLKGWVLTDRTCPSAGCSVPLMRSPSARSPVVFFCASCDGPPEGSSSSSSKTARPQPEPSSASSSSHLSRSSTPPTEVSEASEFVLPPESEQSRRRREQSDLASSAIGERLLKGWAMLAEECPSPTCFGVPLVRPPKAGGDKDHRKECVVCRTVYITEVDSVGRDILVPERPAPASIVEPPPAIASVLVQPPTVPSTPAYPLLTATSSASKPQSLKTALEQSAVALEDSLRVLNSRLMTSTTDSLSIGNTADAISKVAHALAEVKKLQGTM
ncbi:hypothetical protein MIND_00699200 [Mycena indigotica]|uniref:Uncharacterized protein n=1 Tax=Mycena indigotica TaxID=2126181 RepID=A0A8H6SKD9_9AGAR|nr:uncharacterized protein MIND_00699200 [Mycena indigotica]KAF7301340.1 hypothetical protein MIND_00699200 [Mycena indigotica]